MSDDNFTSLINQKTKEYKDVLLHKQKEYATADRLHNFRVSAAFQQCTMEQALFGFLVKHLVSLSDMVKSGELYSCELWDEKIGDSINYLLLLRVIVADKGEQV